MVQFTDTLSNNADAMAVGRVAAPADTSASSAISGLANIGAALSKQNQTSFTKQKFELQQNLASELDTAFQAEVSALRAQTEAGEAGLGQGAVGPLEYAAAGRRATARVNSKFGGNYTAELAKLQSSVIGFNPAAEQQQFIESEYNRQQTMIQQRNQELFKRGLSNEIPLAFGKDGSIDYDATATNALSLNNVIANVNQKTKLDEAMNDNTQLEIRDYSSKLAASFINIAQDPASIEGRAPEASRILSKAGGNETLEPKESRYMDLWLAQEEQNMVNKFVANLGALPNKENMELLKNNIRTGFSDNIRTIINAAGSVEYLKAVNAAEGISRAETNKGLRDNVPGYAEFEAAAQLSPELGRTLLNVSSFSDLNKNINSFIDNRTKKPKDFSDQALKDGAQDSKKYWENVISKNPELAKIEGNSNDVGMGLYKITKPISNSVSDINTVSELLSRKGSAQSILNWVEVNEDREIKDSLVDSLSNNDIFLSKYIRENSSKLQESGMELVRDEKTGVIALRTPQIKGAVDAWTNPDNFLQFPNPLDAQAIKAQKAVTHGEGIFGGGDSLNKLVTAMNSLQVINATRSAISGVNMADANELLQGIPAADLSVISSGKSRYQGLTTVRSEKRSYFLPENQVTRNMITPEFQKLYTSGTVVDDRGNASPRIPGAGGGVFGGLFSAISQGGGEQRVDPVGNLIDSLDNDPLGDLIESQQLDKPNGESKDMKVIDEVIRREGGFVNDPVDRGGATNHGITKKTLEAFRGEKVSVEDVKNLTREEAALIYEEEYLKKPGIDKLPPAIQEFTLDFAVNSGPTTAIKAVQKAAGIKADGVIGPQTIKAAQEVGLRDLVSARIDFITKIVQRDPSQARFLRGWMNRITEFL